MPNKKLITGSQHHLTICNTCTGLLVYRSAFIYDTNACAGGYRPELCFFAEPCASYVYAVALCPDLTIKESNISPYNGTIYSINVTNDAVPFIYFQQDFPANTMNDMFTLFIPANNTLGNSGGYISEPQSFGLVAPPDPFTSEESSIRRANTDLHKGSVELPIATGVVGLGILEDSTIQWIWGWNAGGNTTATARRVVVTNFTQGATYGLAIRDDGEPTEVVWFYSSTLPYTMFDVSEGYVFGTQSDGSLDIIDITTPSTPTLISHTAGVCTNALCLKRDGNTVWIGDAGGDLIAVDVTSFAAPTVSSTTALGDTPEGLDVCAPFIYLALLGGDVVCYDGTTPSAPSPSSTVSVSDFTPYQKQLQLAHNHCYILGIQTSTGKPTLVTLRS